jgi:hypothetical protein
MESRPEHHLGAPLSLLDEAPIFLLGEYILVRIPGGIQVGGQVEGDATAGTALPLTSNGSSSQHFAFISKIVWTDDSFVLEVYPVLSFTSSGGALAGYNEMDDTAKATLLPLPALSHRHPTPEAFGAPLKFGDWSTFRDSWLSIIPRRFVMPASRPASLSFYHWAVFF